MKPAKRREGVIKGEGGQRSRKSNLYAFKGNTNGRSD